MAACGAADIFKALALGASAVGIGRPHAWGLAAFGQPGVEAVLEILRRELRTIMRQAGTVRLTRLPATTSWPLLLTADGPTYGTQRRRRAGATRRENR